MIACTVYPNWPHPAKSDIHTFESNHIPRVGEELCLMFQPPQRLRYFRVVRVRWGVAMNQALGSPQHYARMSTAELWCQEVSPEDGV